MGKTLAHRIVCRCLVLQDGHQCHCQHNQQSDLRHRLYQAPLPHLCSYAIGNWQLASYGAYPTVLSTDHHAVPGKAGEPMQLQV